MVDTETVTVSGNGSYSTPNGYLPTAAGTYQWAASYGGDANNNPRPATNGSEPETVSSATPTISTTAGGHCRRGQRQQADRLGHALWRLKPDGHNHLYPVLPTGRRWSTPRRPRSRGNGSYSTPNGYLPTAAGTYQWVASYAGDTNNNSVHDHEAERARSGQPGQPDDQHDGRRGQSLSAAAAS